MSRTARFVIVATVPDNYGAMQETDLLSLCSLKHQGQLPAHFELQVIGGDFDDLGNRPKPGRENWKSKIYDHLKVRSPQRYTAHEIANILAIPGTASEERKALSETLQRMATRGTIRRERQTGCVMWGYFV